MAISLSTEKLNARSMLKPPAISMFVLALDILDELHRLSIYWQSVHHNAVFSASQNDVIISLF